MKWLVVKVADYEVSVYERTAFEGTVWEDAYCEATIVVTVCKGSVCVKGIVWKQIFNIRSMILPWLFSMFNKLSHDILNFKN